MYIKFWNCVPHRKRINTYHMRKSASEIKYHKDFGMWAYGMSKKLC